MLHLFPKTYVRINYLNYSRNKSLILWRSCLSLSPFCSLILSLIHSNLALLLDYLILLKKERVLILCCLYRKYDVTDIFRGIWIQFRVYICEVILIFIIIFYFTFLDGSIIMFQINLIVSHNTYCLKVSRTLIKPNFSSLHIIVVWI